MTETTRLSVKDTLDYISSMKNTHGTMKISDYDRQHLERAEILISGLFDKKECGSSPELTGHEHGRINDDVSESKSPSGCDGLPRLCTKKPKVSDFLCK